MPNAPKLAVFDAPPGLIPDTPTDPPVLMNAMWSLGFNPDVVTAVIITRASAIALSTDYAEPHIPPEAS